MIRQAISCDICGTDMQQTNHWFVVYEHGVELRIRGWNTRTRLFAGARHLCGQTCLHKLVDDFMARTLSARAPSAVADKHGVGGEIPAIAPRRIDASLTSVASHAVPVRPAQQGLDRYIDEYESSARLVPLPDSAANASGIPANLPAATRAYNTPGWRAEAWKREREREERNTRQRSIA